MSVRYRLRANGEFDVRAIHRGQRRLQSLLSYEVLQVSADTGTLCEKSRKAELLKLRNLAAEYAEEQARAAARVGPLTSVVQNLLADRTALEMEAAEDPALAETVPRLLAARDAATAAGEELVLASNRIALTLHDLEDEHPEERWARFAPPRIPALKWEYQEPWRSALVWSQTPPKTPLSEHSWRKS